MGGDAAPLLELSFFMAPWPASSKRHSLVLIFVTYRRLVCCIRASHANRSRTRRLRGGERTACEKLHQKKPWRAALAQSAADFLPVLSAFEVNICTQTRFHHSWFSNSLVGFAGARPPEHCPRFSFFHETVHRLRTGSAISCGGPGPRWCNENRRKNGETIGN